jgi:hypothetical protein
MNSAVDFTSPQIQCLNALVDTLIPPDDWPGGVDAGVVDYLARLLATDLVDMLPVYKTALDLLDAEAATGSFSGLDSDQRVQLLSKLERGETSQAWPFAPSWWVSMAASHAAEGYYSDPGNGGNRDGVAWKMIGFEVRG